MLKISGHGSIRKIKGGAAGIITLSTLFLGLQGVSADEVTSTSTTEPTTELSSSIEKSEVSKDENKVEDKKVEDKSKVDSTDKKEEVKSSEKEVPKNTDKETYTKVESKEFDIAKKDAKDNGVSVKEDIKPSIKDSQKDVQDDLAKQTKDLKAAQKTQVGSDAITSLDKEKLTEAGIRVVDGKVKLFTDLKEMEAFVKQQSKDIASDIEAKHGMDKYAQLATKELKEVGIEVVVGKEVVKSSPKEAMEALKALQAQVTSAVKTKQELDSAYLALQERAKAAGLLIKEGKGVTLESAKDAKDFLNKQVEEVNTLINSLKKENDKLIGAIATAESYGIKVSKGSNLKVASLKDATENVATQVGKFNTLVKSIEESKTLISTVVENAKKAGVALEGDVVVNSAKGEESKLKEKVTSALKELQDATVAQTSVKEQLAKLVEDAKAKGITVTISGNKKVSVEGVSTELSAIKAKIDKAVADKEKAASDYATAMKNAKEASRLLEGSTAKKEGDVYKQTLTIKSGGTKGYVSLKATGSAEIMSVELVDPAGKKVESVKTLADLTSYTDFSKQGDYVLTYTFRAKDNTAGSVVSSANTNGVAAVEGKASGRLSVTTKAPISTNTENQIEPLTTVHVYDYSSSYAGKVKDSLRLSKKIIEANKNPDSRHILQLYPDNYNQSSYHASTQPTVAGIRGVSSKLLTKQQALDIIDKLLKINSPSEKDPTYPNYGAFFQGLADAMGNNRYLDNTRNDVVPFEEIVDKVTKPTDTVSVIQYTDGWMDQGVVEEMDKSFAEWAKKRAKTFMSVINRNQVTDNDTNSLQSFNQMSALGHPNIYDMTGKDPKVVDAEVVKRFLETATVQVKSTKGEDQLVTVSITGTKTAKVTKATLKGATNKDLPIKDGKVNFSEKLPDGNWTVDYELSGDGDVTVTATVAGKEVVKETKSLKEVKGVEASSTTKTDNLNAVVLPTATEVKPINIEGLTVLAKNVRLGAFEADSTTVAVEKELIKLNFKETVAPINFEREVVPTQAEVTTQDVYLKVVSEKGVPEVLDLPEYHEEKGIPEVHKKEIKEVIAYLDIEDNSVLDDNTTKELPKEAPQFLQNGKYVFTGKTEVIDGITKHYYRKVVPEKVVPETPVQPEGKVLPYTGTGDSSLVQAAGMGLGLVGFLALAGASKPSREED